MILLSKIKDVFNVEPVTSAKMDLGVVNAVNAYKGMPDWVDNEDLVDWIAHIIPIVNKAFDEIKELGD